MRVNLKTGILLVILAIPVFLLLFFQFFGKGHYAVPVFYEDGTALKDCPQQNGTTYRVPVFSLSQINGQPFTQTRLADQLSIIYFFSFPCDTACIKVMEAFARIQHVFEHDSVVQLLSIEETGKSPATLTPLANTYQTIPKKWHYLGGESQFVETLKHCGFVIDEQDIRHPVVLLDTQGKIRGYYEGTNNEEIDRLIVETRILLYSLKQEHD